MRVLIQAEEGWDMAVAMATKRWTLRELHSLPDDGNKYELIRGELFVTPPPSEEHETTVSLLARILEPYVSENQLGIIYRPRAVVRIRASEVEPDLFVRPRSKKRPRSWVAAPLPILIVEVLSPSTRRRDHLQKRNLYTGAGIADYWIVDDEDRTISVVRPNCDDVVVEGPLSWHPAGAKKALRINVEALFREALD